ncbi:hypothetical protein [uncultured Mediterranean phage]|nr:hypothetical protein [uncultured Mediterranean phage]
MPTLSDLSTAGLLPAQHHDVAWAIPIRIVHYRTRIVADDIDTGDWVLEEGATGDEIGWSLWKHEDDPDSDRNIPGWMQAWPCVLDGDDPDNLDVATGGGGESCPKFSRDHTALPIRKDDWEADTRFKAEKVKFPEVDGRSLWIPPRGSYGIRLAGTEEYEQHDLFMSTDPRLFAVNAGGDHRMGTPVCDLTGDHKPDPERCSPLQSMMWVLKKPFSVDAAIAWNIGPSGCKDTEGGFIIDDGEDSVTVDMLPGTGGNTGVTQEIAVEAAAKVVASVSAARNGPFDVGTGKCRHRIGDTADGHPIVSAHIQSGFLLRKNDTEDGPLFIEFFRPSEDAQKVVPVHFGFDFGSKHWRWWSTTNVYVPPGGHIRIPPALPPDTPTDTPGWVPVVDFGIDPNQSTTVSGGPANAAVTGSVNVSGGTGHRRIGTERERAGAGEEIVGYTSDLRPIIQDTAITLVDLARIGEQADRDAGLIQGTAVGVSIYRYAASLLNMATPGLLARPQNYTVGQPDTSRVMDSSNKDRDKVDNETPMTAVMSAYGAEGGHKGTDSYTDVHTGASGDPWAYTQRPGASPYAAGTAPGGFCFHPAEVSLADARLKAMAPDGITVSTIYVTVSPSAFFAAGVPELVDGTIKDGWSWGGDSNNDLVFYSHINSGGQDAGFMLDLSAQDYAFRSNTDFWGTFTHAITANRTWTMQDITGIVALDGYEIVLRVTGNTTLDTSHNNVFCDTDGGAITITLPAGIVSKRYRIVNTGSAANDVTITPDGAELLIGANSSFTLGDDESLIIVYETTEGWY